MVVSPNIHFLMVVWSSRVEICLNFVTLTNFHHESLLVTHSWSHFEFARPKTRPCSRLKNWGNSSPVDKLGQKKVVLLYFQSSRRVTFFDFHKNIKPPKIKIKAFHIFSGDESKRFEPIENQYYPRKIDELLQMIHFLLKVVPFQGNIPSFSGGY